MEQKQKKMLAEVSAKQTELRQKSYGGYAKWERSIRSKLKLDSFA